MNETEISRECIVRRSNKNILAFEPKYNLPSLANYNKVFAGEKNDCDDNHDRMYSVVGIKIVTYETSGSGETKGTTVAANIKPEKLDYLLEMVRQGMLTDKEIQIENEIKVISTGNGKCKVTQLGILRQPVYNGQRKANPWMIMVENGTADLVRGQNGTTTYSKKSYRTVAKGLVQLKDEEFFEILIRCIEHKQAWITSHYGRFLLQSETAIRNSDR